MRLGSIDFSPGWILSLLAAMLLTLFVAAGLWQVDRAEEKRRLIVDYERQSQLPPLALNTLQDAAEMPAHRRVTVTGVYDSDRQFLLDNRIHNGHAGYEVLTPMRVANSDRYVLVNRGWVALGESRALLPVVEVTTGATTIGGRLKSKPEAAFVLSDETVPVTKWPRVIQRIEFTRLAKELEVPLLPVLVLLDADAGQGYVREWPANYGIPPQKHQAYAAQWFSFAVLLIILYIALNSKKIPGNKVS